MPGFGSRNGHEEGRCSWRKPVEQWEWNKHWVLAVPWLAVEGWRRKRRGEGDGGESLGMVHATAGNAGHLYLETGWVLLVDRRGFVTSEGEELEIDIGPEADVDGKSSTFPSLEVAKAKTFMKEVKSGFVAERNLGYDQETEGSDHEELTMEKAELVWNARISDLGEQLDGTMTVAQAKGKMGRKHAR